jgi:P4 family phage/plasmid primase-like protien
MSKHSPDQGEELTFRISVCKNYDAMLPKEVNNSRVASGWDIQEVPWTFDAVRTLVTESGFSPSLLKDGRRSKDTWEGMESIMLDFDDGEMNVADLTSIQQTWEFDSYIFSSQNHQKEKGGQEACDRLRAFIPLSRCIYDLSELETVKQYFLETIPGVDASCFDPSRYFAHGTPAVSHFECSHGFLDVDQAMKYMANSPSGKGPTYTDAVLEGLNRDELDKRIGIPKPEDVSVPESGEYPQRVLDHTAKHPGGKLAQTLSGTRPEDSFYRQSPDGLPIHDRTDHDIAIAGICFRIGCTAREVIQTMLACPIGWSITEWGKDSFDGYEYVLHKVRDAYKRFESEKEADLGEDPPAMAERFLRKQYPKHEDWPTLLRWQDRLYAFTRTHWAPLEEAELDHQINAFLASTEKCEKAGTYYEASVKRNVIAKAHLSNKVGLGEWLDGRDEGFQINLKSCLLNVGELLKGKSKPMHSHSPAFFTTSCLPFPYDNRATCPRWLTFLDEVLPNPNLQQMLKQMFGLFLIPETSYQRFWVLLGPAGTGKSTVSYVLTRLLGDDNVSSVSLEQMREPFTLITLLGKLANISSEIETQEIRAGERIIKGITGEDQMALNEKYKPIIHATLTARLLFTCNQLPLFKDYGGSIGRRLIIIPMDEIIPAAKRDAGLWPKLESELPGIFNWALEGLRDLRKHGLFEASVAKKAVKEHLAEGKPWEGWIVDTLDFDSTYSSDLGCTEVYQAFEVHFQELGYRRVMNEAAFGKALKEVYPKVIRIRSQVNGQRSYRYAGLMWRTFGPTPSPIPMNFKLP